ncbi:MAG: 1,4-dihydroxy-2-naphthoate octaprenyltransferase [Chlamydiia bacterium]
MSPWIAAARPHTLLIGLYPVWLGALAAWQLGEVTWWWIVPAMLIALSLQIGVNFHNDLRDGLRGADREDRIGPARMVASGCISPRAMRWGVIGCMTLALTLGLVTAACRFPWALPAMAICVLAALSYSAGTRPASHRGLGDLLTLLFFGPVACVGTTYLLSLQTTPLSWTLGLACGCFSVAFIAINNIRDIDADRKIGKQTLAVRFGESFGRYEIASMLVLPCLLAWTSGASLGCVSLLWSGPFIKRMPTTHGPAWNREWSCVSRAYAVFVLGVTSTLLLT